MRSGSPGWWTAWNLVCLVLGWLEEELACSVRIPLQLTVYDLSLWVVQLFQRRIFECLALLGLGALAGSALGSGEAASAVVYSPFHLVSTLRFLPFLAQGLKDGPLTAYSCGRNEGGAWRHNCPRKSSPLQGYLVSPTPESPQNSGVTSGWQGDC